MTGTDKQSRDTFRGLVLSKLNPVYRAVQKSLQTLSQERRGEHPGRRSRLYYKPQGSKLQLTGRQCDQNLSNGD